MSTERTHAESGRVPPLTDPVSYEGDLHDGVPTGLGTGTWADGRTYTGQWIDGVPNGRGVVTHPCGDRAEGRFVDGVPHGGCLYTWADGSSFRVMFTRGRAFGGYLRTGGRLYIGPMEGMLFRGRGDGAPDGEVLESELVLRCLLPDEGDSEAPQSAGKLRILPGPESEK